MTKLKFSANKEQAQKAIEKVKKTYKKAAVNEIDGCRLDFEEGWVHIRTSNTEPIMRLIAEFKNEDEAGGYLKKITGIIEKITG